jgi:hypothetical protein
LNWTLGAGLPYFHIFVKARNVPELCLIQTDPNINPSTFVDVDWSDFYDLDECKEEVAPNMPRLRGNDMSMSAFVDAKHAGNIVTHYSHTGILIFLQNAPIIWYSKRQNTVERSTFRSEFVALLIA